MKYTCPKCGKHIELSVEALIASEYKTICPQCLTQLEIVGDYAYVPLDDGSLELRRDSGTVPQSSSAEVIETAEVIDCGSPPPPLPSQLGGDGRDPLFDDAVRYLSQCNAITPMMLRDYFGISIERAQDLIAQLEQAGCVGPYRGGAPRKILIDHHEGLPNPYTYGQRYNPNQTQQASQGQPGEQPQGGKTVKINCVGCLFWILLFSLLIFLMVK